MYITVEIQNITNIEIQNNEPSRIRNAQSVSQGPFKMGKRKLEFMNG